MKGQLSLFFALVVLLFWGAIVVANLDERSIDRQASAIADVGAPSIRHLATARTELRRLQAAIQEALEDDRGDTTAVITSSRAAMDAEIQSYLELPHDPGDRALWDHVREDLSKLDASAHAVRVALAYHDPARARAVETTDLRDAVEALSASLGGLMNANAARMEHAARRIEARREQGEQTELALAVACTILAAVAAWLASMLVRRQARLLEERSDELEMFAARVAHDILSPLSAVGLSLDLVKMNDSAGSSTRAVQRGRSSLFRVQRIVNALLEFARAGAHPTPGDAVEATGVVDDVLDALGDDAAARGCLLVAEPSGPAWVACSAGVLESVLENLVQNAIKYIGTVDQARVTVRLASAGGRVRFEVEDTGPGLPPGAEARVFEPYARGPGVREPGLGLGLATVKRLIEAHGGRVGARSVEPHGALFWFELPAASEARSTPHEETHAP